MVVNTDVRMKGFHKKVPVDKALKILLQNTGVLETEKVQIANTLGRFLSEDLVASQDIPPFTRAAMDGYALKGENTFGASQINPIYFKLIGNIPTGKVSRINIHEFEAARIMTGAPLPHGANAVVMFEHGKEFKDEIEVFKAVSPGKHASLKGEDVEKGEFILKKGHKIQPQDIAIMAAMGISNISVFRQPCVSIIATGDELKEPGMGLNEAEIYDANSYSLHALVERTGGIPKICGIISDNYKELVKAVKKALKSDLIIISGATSVGEKDYVPKVISDLGAILVHGVAMRPGKPTGFGVVENKLVIMVPGYPVAAIFSFQIFIRHVLEKMQGCHTPMEGYVIKGKLKRKIPSQIGRRDYVRVVVDLKHKVPLIDPIRTGGSGIITSIIRANGFIIVPENTEGLRQGKIVEVNIF
tara:strand:- start:2116 stop:3360 length:1245 start_codon:yes stop_codon:yes gene_type:complete